jgi:hypothetical protein
LVSNVFESYFYYNTICQRDCIQLFKNGGHDDLTMKFEKVSTYFHAFMWAKYDVLLYLFDYVFTLSMFFDNTHNKEPRLIIEK